jgi:hypothetical protein
MKKAAFIFCTILLALVAIVVIILLVLRLSFIHDGRDWYKDTSKALFDRCKFVEDEATLAEVVAIMGKPDSDRTEEGIRTLMYFGGGIKEATALTFRFKDEVLVIKSCWNKESKEITAEVTAIKQYCSDAELTKNSPQKFDYIWTEKEAKWQKVLERDFLDIAYQGADVWTKNGSVILAHTYTTSPSGDWVHYSNYCFREDGTLAGIQAILNTSYASEDNYTTENNGVSVLRDYYFASDGRQLIASTTVLNLKTRKPSKAAYQHQDVAIYQNVNELPFINLVELI